MREVIINTDIGGDFDDLLALVLALNSRELTIKGVVTTKEHIRDKAKFARKILDVFGRRDIPTFYAGQLKGKKGKYISVNDYNFLSREEQEADDQKAGISSEGIEFIVRSIKENPEKITLVSLAPNTNLATAMQQSPDIVSKIKSIYLMGGVFERNELNLNKPEHNYSRDRKSFDYVTSCGVPVYMIPRDITLDLFLGNAELEQLRRTEKGKVILKLARSFLDFTKRDSLRLADAIAIGSLLFPDIYDTVPTRLVSEKGANGAVVYCQPAQESQIHVFYNFARSAFLERLKERLFSLPSQ